MLNLRKTIAIVESPPCYSQGSKFDRHSACVKDSVVIVVEWPINWFNIKTSIQRRYILIISSHIIPLKTRKLGSFQFYCDVVFLVAIKLGRYYTIPMNPVRSIYTHLKILPAAWRSPEETRQISSEPNYTSMTVGSIQAVHFPGQNETPWNLIAILHLKKIGRNCPQQETRKYSNHPFSGAFAVSFIP